MSRTFQERSGEGFRDQVSNGRILEKIYKMIPTEVIAAYVAFSGLIPKLENADTQFLVKWIIFFFCLVLTPLYLKKLSKKGHVSFNHLFLSTIAFVIWAYAVSGQMLVPDKFDSALSSILLIIFTLISGLIPLDK